MHRDSKLIGVVRVSDLEDYRCVANIEQTYDLFELQNGDAVIYIDMKTAPDEDEEGAEGGAEQAAIQ